MTVFTYAGCAMTLGVALSLSTAATAGAQTDTTQRAQSERRIPVRKDQGVTRRESGGEVRLSADRARIDSLEAIATTYRERLDSISAATATLATRTEATERTVTALQDSLKAVHTELTTARADLTATKAELTTVSARTNAIGDSLLHLNQRFAHFRNGSLFGNSGFYIGFGTGANFTNGTLSDIGYHEGLNVSIPVGWSKPGQLLGVRGEFGVQTFDGRITGVYSNPDPKVYTAVGMVTLNFPMNAAKNNIFYLMGGGGAYMFRDIGGTSGLRDHLGGSITGGTITTNETKWGVQGGAGLELHILGATSFFVQTAMTNVFAEKGSGAVNSGSNLRWIPLIAGITLR